MRLEMDYIEKIVELVNDIALSAMSGNYDKYDRARELVTEILGWNPMDTAPKDRHILVYNIPPNKYNIEPNYSCCITVMWSTWSYEWVIVGSQPDEYGDYPTASNPVAWMELPEYVVQKRADTKGSRSRTD
jgi:hypothetical protein